MKSINSITFIDTAIEGYLSLVEKASLESIIIIIDPNQNGLLQISMTLEKFSNLQVIHVISHGSKGQLQLGNIIIDDDNLSNYEDALAVIGEAMSGTGDLLLYGCNVAKGQEGNAFVSRLAQLTQVDVAASDDITGYGGNWLLEQKVGEIEESSVEQVQAILAIENYLGQLEYIEGTPESDVLHGSVDGDQLLGGKGNDNIWGHDGNDKILGEAGNDVLYGGSGNDQIEGSDGADVLWGGEGDDQLEGGDGADVIWGDDGNDVIWGGAGTDVLYGNAGNDEIEGNEGDDIIWGGDGDDIIWGGVGHDVLSGGIGADVFYASVGDDLLIGDDGIDTVVYSGNQENYSIQSSDKIYVIDNVGIQGNDELSGVERLEFADKKIAMDLDGNAGIVAKIIGATYGVESLDDEVFIGIGLQALDAGMSYEDLLGYTISAAGGGTSEEIVDILWENVVGSLPNDYWSGLYVAQIDDGTYTPVSFGMLATEHELNISNINLIGLAQTGLEFI